MYCVDYTNINDCCVAYFPEGVRECTGGGGAGSHCCWSYGNAVCYWWGYCYWDGEECQDGYECGVEEADEQDCFT